MVFRALAPLVVILRQRMLAGARQRFLPAAERGLQARRDGLETIGGERPLRRSMSLCPAARMISANSRSGRVIYRVYAGVSGNFDADLNGSESRGLAVALRCTSDMCR